MVFGPDELIRSTAWYIELMKTYYLLHNAGIIIRIYTEEFKSCQKLIFFKEHLSCYNPNKLLSFNTKFNSF
jgi:hypothetical protein